MKRILYICELLIALFLVLKYPIVGDILAIVIDAMAIAYIIETPIV